MATRAAYLCYFLGFLFAVVGQLSARVIHGSPGGTGAYAMQLAHEPILVIAGRCHSACAWGALWNPHACVTPSASLQLHAAHDPGTGKIMEGVTRMWIETLPVRLKSYGPAIMKGGLVPIPRDSLPRCP